MNNILGRKVDSYLPLYDDFSDFNTNAKSYYDYLARQNKMVNIHTDFINRLLLRDIEGLETKTNTIEKVGNWLDNGKGCPPDNYDDVIKLGVNTKISKHQERNVPILDDHYTIGNGLSIKDDGLYTFDYRMVYLKHDLTIKDHIRKIKKLEEKTDDIEKNIQSMLGLNLKTLNKGIDYELTFYNGFKSPTDDLVVQIGETNTHIDIYIRSHSASNKVLKHDGDLREKTLLSLTPSKEYDPKCRVFSLKLNGEYAKYNNKEIVLDSTIETLWHMRPVTERASWSNLLTPHNINGQFEYNWRQISDGFGSQLKNTYKEALSLEWGNIDTKIKIEK